MSIFDSWYLPFLILPYSPFQKNETLKTWHNWLLSNWSRLLNWKGPGTKLQSSKSLKGFQKNIAVAYTQKLTTFGWLMSCDSKDIFKNVPASCDNTHHDVTDLVNHEMIKNTKTWISCERNKAFLWNKKILNLCLRCHILRSYRFVPEVPFN